MGDARTADELFTEGREQLPKWNDDGPDTDARSAAAVVLITQAAELGHPEAMELLADGLAGDDRFRWQVRLAKLGEPGPLNSGLSGQDVTVEEARSVLDAARAGEAWAMDAIGALYGLGMVNTATGEPVATKDGAFGFLPGAADPRAEARRWFDRAIDAGWALTMVRRVHAMKADEPARALELLTLALEPGRVLPEADRARLRRLSLDLMDDTDVAFDVRREARQREAEAGHAESWAWLGEAFLEDGNPPADPVAARKAFERAAAGGSVDGLRELGKMLESGLGGPVDDDRAKALYEQAAELGNDAHARDRLASKWGLSWYARGPDEA